MIKFQRRWRGISVGEACEHVAELRGRVELYVEPRDLWIGAFIGADALYLCPLPVFVIRISLGRRWES